MKQLLCFLLSLLSLFSLSGCNSSDNNTVFFYYSRSPELYQYFEEDSVIHAEQRDLTGHRNDLRYMLGLYLAGPLEEGLTTPFTKSTRLISVEQKENVVFIELSDHASIMTDVEFSLACASLTLTCLHFTQCDAVSIVSGDRSITMNGDSIVLYDSLPQQEPTGG